MLLADREKMDGVCGRTNIHWMKFLFNFYLWYFIRKRKREIRGSID